jgi:CPA1 family monovalent cation:H+ antiporter
MALSLSREAAVPGRELILVVTYVVVVFSVLVQGLTLGPVARRWLGRPTPAGGPGEPPKAGPDAAGER